MIKLIAFLVAAITAWLAYGATTLHQKDPSHYGLTLPLALGAIAVVSLLVLFSGGKSKAKSSR
ncbi:hypothetical protein OG439_32580 [Amycolatopsis sp. NBC_01307]|uniref:hypothetical protein n=1 Tax=Amycolatopsis sp. NBC_01307 TaxID=2903561 RepID=UPI002E0F5203|nr:hypothetical protein OG439_32580 [Amycolatopsis sp. NBC_01307]